MDTTEIQKSIREYCENKDFSNKSKRALTHLDQINNRWFQLFIPIYRTEGVERSHELCKSVNKVGNKYDI